jgi:hypothetical protein
MTERAASLLATLSIRGIVVTPAGAYLRLCPRAALTPDLVAQVRDLKAEIFELLTSGALPTLAAAGAWPTPEEWRVLEALARVPCLTERELLAVTKLPYKPFVQALGNLQFRGEITISADGRLRLRAN